MIERMTFRIIEMKIRRYPETKKNYEAYVSEVMSRSGSSAGYKVKREEDNKPQSCTEAAALKMTSKYADQLKKEIEAIETVYNSLSEEEQKLMRQRFWSNPRKITPYSKMSVCYSERQQHRIVFKIISKVGKYLGEIN